jgi:hypothetical protein
MMDWKGFGRKWCDAILRYYLGIRLKVLSKTTKASVQPLTGPRFEHGTSRIRERVISLAKVAKK